MWNYFNFSFEAYSFRFNAFEEADCLILDFPPLLPSLDLVSTSQTSNVILMLGGGLTQIYFHFKVIMTKYTCSLKN